MQGPFSRGLPAKQLLARLPLESQLVQTAEDTAVAITLTGTDTEDSHRVAVHWGDGTSFTKNLSEGVDSFSASHAYLLPGIYTIGVTVDDLKGGSDWLLVSGVQAQCQGRGSLNGIGNYQFLLTLADDTGKGRQAADKLRIQIWDKATGKTVYDNLLGTVDRLSLANLPPIGGGSLVIHNSK